MMYLIANEAIIAASTAAAGYQLLLFASIALYDALYSHISYNEKPYLWEIHDLFYDLVEIKGICDML